MVVCYIAQSLDGFIATPEGGLDWLPQPKEDSDDYGYQNFLDSVDALIMGHTTYDQVRTFGPWPYENKQTIVFSHNHQTIDPLSPWINFTQQDPHAILDQLKSKGARKIWMVGGSHLLASFREQGLVDQYIITTVPTVLGKGIPLFQPGPRRELLCCTNSHRYPDGLVQSTYQKVSL